ncbi:hypothetical protein ACLBWS_03680 [Brucellaceae bacterium D45D]
METPVKDNLKSRIFLLAELILCVLPTLMALGQFILFMTLFGFGGLVVTLYSLLTFGDRFNIEHLVFSATMSGLSIATFASLFYFLTLSISHIDGENIRTKRHRRKFWLGLSLAVLPLIFAMIISMMEASKGGEHWLWLFYMSGLPMLIPVIHLASATKPIKPPSEGDG